MWGANLTGVELCELNATQGRLAAVPTGSFALSYVRFSRVDMPVGNHAAVFVEGEIAVVEDEVARIKLPPKQVHALKADPHGQIRCALQIRCTPTAEPCVELGHLQTPRAEPSVPAAQVPALHDRVLNVHAEYGLTLQLLMVGR